MKLNEQNYVDTAEQVILKLKEKKGRDNKPIPLVTTSKLRNLLAMAADIYNQILNQHEDRLNEDICGRIEYLRVRFLYEAGREPAVRDLVEEAGIIDLLKQIKGSKKQYMLFSRYMEALVSFRKYYDRNDS